MRHVVVASAVVLLTLAPRAGLADGITKDQCVQANTRAQELRKDGKLLAAGDQLRACAVPACPRLVRDDCARRLDDLEKVQPTIVFVAKGPGKAKSTGHRRSVRGLMT